MFGPETFIVRVAEDAMAPRVRAGDYIRVDPDEPGGVNPRPTGRSGTVTEGHASSAGARRASHERRLLLPRGGEVAREPHRAGEMPRVIRFPYGIRLMAATRDVVADAWRNRRAGARLTKTIARPAPDGKD